MSQRAPTFRTSLVWLLLLGTLTLIVSCDDGDDTDDVDGSSDLSQDVSLDETLHEVDARELPLDGHDAGHDTEDDRHDTGDAGHDAEDEEQDAEDAEHDVHDSETTTPTLREQLEEIPGMAVISEQASADGGTYFDLRFSQPVDHDQPEGAQFEQLLSLVHQAHDAPMNLVSTGYYDYLQDTPTELTQMLGSNQLVVEHRYFGASIPDPVEWEYLTIEQAAADHHRVVEAIHPLYPGVWLSSGASKGGQASMFHRRFYPDDVQGTVTYESPVTFGAPDGRYAAFIEAIPELDCQARLVAIQNEALLRRDDLVTELELEGYTYDLIGDEDRAVESLVISLPFTFWQYTGVGGCTSIPELSATTEEIFSFLDWSVGFYYFSDEGFEPYLSYYYQAHTELGYPDTTMSGLTGLSDPPAPTLEEGVLPAGVSPVYSDAAMTDIVDWVDRSGSQLMFVYGEYDPWTAGAFELGGAVDSYVFTVPEGTHLSDLIDLPATDRELVVDVLEDWTGIPVTLE